MTADAQTRVRLTPGPVATLTLEDSRGLNLLSVATARSLLQQLLDLRAQPDLMVLILTGSPGSRAFCAGADMRELLALKHIPAYVELGQELTHQLEHFPVPVIAALNGYALGAGFSLAMACDLRVISENAKIGQLAVLNGLVPPFGNLQQILQIAGAARGRELIYTGRILNAEEAERYQLVNRVVEPAQLMEAAHELAAAIARSPTRAVRLAKAVLVRTLEEGHALGYALQEEALMECLSSQESREIMEGFLDQA
ncbi:MAG: enoyl-CoA hydratase/isomerase family protein [Candidatus Sericytochromatia bacterium]